MQPYYLAWYGFFEQIKFADIYVFYDDVQYVKRSLMSRVSIKTQSGSQWLSIPLSSVHQGDLIKDIQCFEKTNWREDHLNRLKEFYRNAPFFSEMYELASIILRNSDNMLISVTVTGILEICKYFGLDKNKIFIKSSDLNIKGEKTDRLLKISKELGAEIYLTGMGALNYLDYNLFEKNKINVEYIKYAKSNYPQGDLPFNPYVSILDLIAWTGNEGYTYFNSYPVHYFDFIKSKEARDYLNLKS